MIRQKTNSSNKKRTNGEHEKSNERMAAVAAAQSISNTIYKCTVTFDVQWRTERLVLLLQNSPVRLDDKAMRI